MTTSTCPRHVASLSVSEAPVAKLASAGGYGFSDFVQVIPSFVIFLKLSLGNLSYVSEKFLRVP